MNERETDALMDKLLWPYWQDYVAESDFNEIFPEEDQLQALFMMLKVFMGAAMIGSEGFVPLSEVTEENIQMALQVANGAVDESEDMREFTDGAVRIGHSFLAWLSLKGVISVNDQEIDDLFDENALEMTAFDSDNSERTIYHYDQPNLPEYDEKIASDIADQSSSLIYKFIESGALDQVLDQLDTEYAISFPACIEGISAHMYGEYRQTPSEWTGPALKGVLLDFGVKDSILYPEDYQYIGPILKAFFEFVSHQNLISPKSVEPLKVAVDAVTPQLIQLGENEDNFSELKRAVLTMLTDKAASALDQVQDDYQNNKVVSLNGQKKKRKNRKRNKHK